jgi:hypothetical protein
MEKIKEAKQTTCNEMAKAISVDYGQESESQDENPEQIPVSTLHRRIYDIISVMSVVGLIQKKDKTIIWRGENRWRHRPINTELKILKNKVSSKEEVLKYKLSILLLLKTVIADNASVARPSKAVQLPFLVLASGNRSVRIKKDAYGHSMEIGALGSLDVFSPIDALMEKRFHVDKIRSVIENTAELSKCRDFLEDIQIERDV